MSRLRVVWLLVLALVSAGLAACGGGGAGGGGVQGQGVVAITIDAPRTSIAVGERIQLVLEATDQAVRWPTVKWAGGQVVYRGTLVRGQKLVLRPGPKYDEITRNIIEETCFASMAVSQGHFYIRSAKHLYSIGASPVR